MKLFALGASWAIYAIAIFLGASLYFERSSNFQSVVDSSVYYDKSVEGRTVERARQAKIRKTCAGSKGTHAIYDREDGATYVTRCTTRVHAITIYSLSTILIASPVALFIWLRRRRKTSNAQKN